MRRYGRSRRDDAGASVFGIPHGVAFETAAFANGCHVRYLDFNDAYFAPGGGHPSDIVAALLAAAEARGASGPELLTAIYVAYEVFGAVADAVPLGEMGWDMGAQCSLSAAAGLANLLGLDRAGAAHAVSLALTPSMPLRVTRTGELSQWKGCAAPFAAATALTAACLAEMGLTGPGEPFSGPQGLFSHVGEFSLDIGHHPGGRSAFDRTAFKVFPAVYHAQGPIEMALDLRPQVDIDAIERITISTYEGAWLHAGGGLGDHAEKWDPETRETADHSIPYLVAVALVDGAVTIDSFTHDRVRDPALRPLMDKLEVVVDDTLPWGHGAEARPAARMDVFMADDSSLGRRVEYPAGHPRQPLSDVALGEKAAGLALRVLSPPDARLLVEMLWDVASLDDLRPLGRLMRSFGSSASHRPVG